MSYGTVLAWLLASVVGSIDAELSERLASLWRRIAQRVSFF